MAETNVAEQAKMDAANLYAEEIVTDRKAGTIHILTPITVTGERDAAREQIFMGESQIMTQMGPMPLTFEIPAKTLAEAVEGYGQAAEAGLRQMVERIEALRREAATQIVTPGMPGYQAPPSGGLVMP